MNSGRVNGLDGLRGIALLLIMGFHFYPKIVPGGPFSLCLFFALSGYLVTSLALREMEQEKFQLRKFYAKRIRRLIPASLLVLVVLALSWNVLNWFDSSNRRDVLFSALQISNWQQIWQGRPYGMVEASPVLHFWSLGIEVQLYVALSIVFAVSGFRRLKYILPLLFLGSVVGLVLANDNRTLAYYGTHIRAAEMLAGAIVAVYMYKQRPLNRKLATFFSVTCFGLIVLATFIYSLNDDLVYRGGLVVSGVLSAILVGVLSQSHLRWFFELPIFVYVGKISYGAYLLHWCIYVSLDHTALTQWAVPVLTLALTLLLADLMLRFYENPMRIKFSTKKFVSVLAVVAVVGSASIINVNAAPLTFEDAQRELDAMEKSRLEHPQVENNWEHFRVGFVGDSKMLTLRLGAGLMDFIEPVFVNSQRGCPLGRGGLVTVEDTHLKVDSNCTWDNVPNIDADVVAVWYGSWDASNRKVDALGDRWVSIDDPDYESWLRSEYMDYFQMLRDRTHAQVIAVMNVFPNGDPDLIRFNEFLDSLTIEPDVRVLDDASFFESVDVDYFLPDGVHLTMGRKTTYSDGSTNTAKEFAQMWLTPSICRSALEVMGSSAPKVTCGAVRDH